MSTTSTLDRTFRFENPASWSGRNWKKGDSVAVRWIDAARLNFFPQISLSGSAAVGGALSVNVVTVDVEARLTSTIVHVTGDVTVEAADQSTMTRRR